MSPMTITCMSAARSAATFARISAIPASRAAVSIPTGSPRSVWNRPGSGCTTYTTRGGLSGTTTIARRYGGADAVRGGDVSENHSSTIGYLLNSPTPSTDGSGDNARYGYAPANEGSVVTAFAISG